MGGGIKKEYRSIDNRPVLAGAIIPFIESAFFSIIIVTVPVSQIKIVRKLLKPFIDVNTDGFIIIEGGATRRESVYLGLLELKAVNPEYVLIHDGARPWIDKETIIRVMDGTCKHGACLPLVKARDALKDIGENGFIEKHLSRNKSFCAQTPQGFCFSGILEAHKKAATCNKLFIDDGEIYAEYIGPVFTVTGDVKNRKITYLHDIV